MPTLFNRLQSITLLLLFFVLFYSCQKETPEENGTELTFRVMDVTSLPAALQRVRISEYNNDSSYVYAVTDSLGWVKTRIPAGRELVIGIKNTCSEQVYYQRFPAIFSDTSLGTIKTTKTVLVSSIISGVLKDCSGAPLQNGYVTILNGSSRTTGKTDKDGKYSVSVNICGSSSATVYVSGIDSIRKQQNAQAVPVDVQPNKTYELSPIQACGISIEEYLRVNVNGTSYTFDPSKDNISAGREIVFSFPPDSLTYVRAFKVSASDYFQLSFYGSTSPGSNANFYADIYLGSQGLEGANKTFQVVTTEYGARGEFITGSFTAVMFNKKENKNVPVSGEFRVRRGG